MGKVAKKSRWGSHLQLHCHQPVKQKGHSRTAPPPPLYGPGLSPRPHPAGSREPGEGAHEAEKSPPRAPLPPAASR